MLLLTQVEEFAVFSFIHRVIIWLLETGWAINSIIIFIDLNLVTNFIVYDLQFMDKIFELMAHNSEILSLQYFPLNEQCMLANDRVYLIIIS